MTKGRAAPRGTGLFPLGVDQWGRGTMFVQGERSWGGGVGECMDNFRRWNTPTEKKKKDIIKSGPVLMTRTCSCLSPLQVQVPHFEGKAVVNWRTDCDNQHELAQRHTHTQVAKEVFDFFFFFFNARLGSSFTWQKIKLYNLRVQICGKVHVVLLYLLLNAVGDLFPTPPFRWKTMT